MLHLTPSQSADPGAFALPLWWELHREGGLAPGVIAQSAAADGVCRGSLGTGKTT